MISLREISQRISAVRAELTAGRYTQAAQALDVLLAELLDTLQRQALAQYQGSRKRATRKVLRSMLKAV